MKQKILVLFTVICVFALKWKHKNPYFTLVRANVRDWIVSGKLPDRKLRFRCESIAYWNRWKNDGLANTAVRYAEIMVAMMAAEHMDYFHKADTGHYCIRALHCLWR